MRTSEYRPDFTTTQVIKSTGSDSSVTIPENLPGSLMSNPLDAGSLYYLCVDGGPMAINYGGAAVVPTSTGTKNAILEVGNNLTTPVNIPPGTVVHAISLSGTAYLSIIRARRA